MARALTYSETVEIKNVIRECGNYLAVKEGKIFSEEGVETILAEGLANQERIRSDMTHLGKKFYYRYLRTLGVTQFFIDPPATEPASVSEPVSEPATEPASVSEPVSEPASVSEPTDVGDAQEALSPFMKYVVSTVINEMDAKIKVLADTITPAPREVIVKTPTQVVKIDGTVHPIFDTVLAYVSAHIPVYLSGPAGTGKNVLCKQIAEALGLTFYSTNAVTQEHKLTGFKDAHGNYHETEFYKAFTKGGLFMLDEMDASIPEVLIILNSAIANGYFEFPNGRAEAHPDFYIISAGNTCGTGATYTYNGRNQLDGASLDRFAFLEMDYAENIEMANANYDKELVKFAHALRKAGEKAGMPNLIISPRGISMVAKMKDTVGLSQAIKAGMVKGMDKADLNTLIGALDCYNHYAEALRELAH